ncbi:YdcF family protein [Bacteroides fragilis]|uniref:SanA/YdcF family protein n=1 Tax=Bacteroides fragilis TaxID=817 RepID=UPI00202EF1EB|nr:ElyC/SanA/YdcF family protein [Bacteroides fragilis]MCM0340874.1 YdcF family protein [Bacteroides fragilis]
MKKIIFIGAPLLLTVLVITIYVCNRTIQKNSEAYLYSTVSDIPYNKVGLLLGTSPKLKNGKNNLYFDYRIKAATELYNTGKIKYILVSGDNRRNDYNEPEEMKQALIATGIPEQQIILDYAGLRTLDSVIRAHLIFGLERFTLISQEFHNERAIFLAQQNHLQVIGYNAQDVSAYAGFKTNLRELLARVKVFMDIITDKAPKHLGEKVEIPE